MKKTTDSIKRKPLTTNLAQKSQTYHQQPNFTKKLSLALEEKLRVEDTKISDEEIYKNIEKNENEDMSQSTSALEKKQTVLEKAKALIEKSKTMTTNSNSNPKPGRKYKTTAVPKDDAFLTSIHVIADNYPKFKPKPETYEEEPSENLNEDEMMKNLWLDNYNENDDLAELRKMINKTKKNISDYASELYTLKNNVNDVNLVYNDLGYKVKNNDLMYEMDKVFDEIMPKGDKNSMFTYEFYDNPARNQERKAVIPNQKKQGAKESSKKKHGKHSSLLK